MKKYLWIIAGFSSISADAQINNIHLGIDVGTGLSLYYTDHNFLKTAIIVPAGGVGAVCDYDFTKHFSLSTGLWYNESGGEGYNLRPIVISTRSHYLTVPVLFKAGYGKKVFFYGIVGPYLGVMLKTKGIYSNPNIPIHDWYRDVSSQFSRIDFGITAGIGFRVPIKKHFAFIMEERNNIGLVTVSHILSGNGQKNFSALFTFGATYTLHKKPLKKHKR